MRRILLGLTGSVASTLHLKLIQQLQTIGIVDVIITKSVKPFIDFECISAALHMMGGKIYQDEDEWIWEDNRTKYQKDDKVLHIELRNRSSALVIAPCSANTLAKISNGICDNLLTCVARAWDPIRPVIIAPSMNTQMWNHPITSIHLKMIAKFSNHNDFVYPQYKMLACNTEGMGAMAEIDKIVDQVSKSLRWVFPIHIDYFDMPKYGIPIEGHPGSFLSKRKNSTHTGIDIYVDVGKVVVPVEDGIVVGIEHFTGPQVQMPWWLDTDCVLVEGASGVICYGEVEPLLKVGDKVSAGGTAIGKVMRVIRPEFEHPEVPGWKPSMLHLEWYPHGKYAASDGYAKDKDILRDPTQMLIQSWDAPTQRYTKDGIR